MISDVERLYHGGHPGLCVGDRVLPPDATGAPSAAQFGAAAVCRADRVYVTTSPMAARMFAALHYSGRGCVYVVQPDAETLAHDPDCAQPGLSFQAAHATVLGVLPMSKSARNKYLRSLGVEPKLPCVGRRTA